MPDVKITLTSKPHDGKKYPWLTGRAMWGWTLEYGGKTYDGGKPGMEVHLAADNAIAKYRQLFFEEQHRRNAANQRGKKAAA